MFSRSTGPRAQRGQAPDPDVVGTAEALLLGRAVALEQAGVARSRIVLDPGMGFFLGEGPEPSLAMLRALPRLRGHGMPLLVSVSRKAFLGELTGRSRDQRGAATLAAEVFAAIQGVAFVRTHEPAPLRDALAVLRALGTVVED
jgi:dihydropteroate synthase type 2